MEALRKFELEFTQFVRDNDHVLRSLKGRGAVIRIFDNSTSSFSPTGLPAPPVLERLENHSHCNSTALKTKRAAISSNYLQSGSGSSSRRSSVTILFVGFLLLHFNGRSLTPNDCDKEQSCVLRSWHRTAGAL